MTGEQGPSKAGLTSASLPTGLQALEGPFRSRLTLFFAPEQDDEDASFACGRCLGRLTCGLGVSVSQWAALAQAEYPAVFHPAAQLGICILSVWRGATCSTSHLLAARILSACVCRKSVLCP